MTQRLRGLALALGLVAAFATPLAAQAQAPAPAPAPARAAPPAQVAPTPMAGGSLYELRTYMAAPGRVKDVEAEFKSWIIPGLARVGVHPVAYWSNDTDKPGVTYLMVFKDLAERDAAWAKFRADPETEKARVAATADYAGGARAMTGADIRLMVMTDFSPRPKTADGATLR